METEHFESLPVPKAIIKFAVPTILSQLVTLLYNLADTFFVGHTNDPNQVAALTLSFPIFMLLTAIGNLMGIGANSMISRSLGRGETEQARRASAFGFYGGVFLTVILSVALFFSMRPVLTVIGASQDTYHYTSSYLLWTVVIGGIPTVINMLLGHLIRAEGNTRQASIGMTMGGIINIALDPVLVQGFHMGIVGAAVATAVSNMLAMIYFFHVLYRNRNRSVISLKQENLGFHGNVISEENTVKTGVGFLKYWILCTPGMCFVNMFNSIFQAMGKWRQSMFLSIFRQALLLIPLLIIFNQIFGLYGLIWSQPVSDTLSLLLGMLLYVLLLRKNRPCSNVEGLC